jgi:hypothetical protein
MFMIARYIATLAATVLVVTLLVSPMPFVVRSCVLSGSTVNEDVRLEFTFDADRDHTLIVTPEMAEELQNHVNFPTDGAAHILESKASVTPDEISWQEGNRRITAQGAVMTAHLRWNAAADASNGASGSIYVEFPASLSDGKAPTFHGGQYQVLKDGRCAIREITAYRSPAALYLARFGLALVAGLPFGILLHSIGWAFLLKREKQARLRSLPPQNAGLPQVFPPNPILEWSVGLFLLGLGASIASLIAGLGIFDNYIGSSLITTIYVTLAIAMGVAVASAYSAGKSALTIRIDPGGFSYMRGRDDADWTTAAWEEVVTVVEKSRKNRGTTTYWIEIKFKDGRKKLKVPTSTVYYPALRKLLLGEKA